MIFAGATHDFCPCDASNAYEVMHPAAFKLPTDKEATDVKSPENIHLIFNYGPYSCDGVIKHRRNRLKGLVRKLQERFNKIVISFKPTNVYNRLTVTLDDHVLFECKITNLSYDGDCTDYTSLTGYQAIRMALIRILDIKDRYKLNHHPHSSYMHTF